MTRSNSMSSSHSSIHIRNSSRKRRTESNRTYATMNIGYIIGTWRSSAYYSAYYRRHNHSNRTELVMYPSIFGLIFSFERLSHLR